MAYVAVNAYLAPARFSRQRRGEASGIESAAPEISA